MSSLLHLESKPKSLLRPPKHHLMSTPETHTRTHTQLTRILHHSAWLSSSLCSHHLVPLHSLFPQPKVLSCSNVYLLTPWLPSGGSKMSSSLWGLPKPSPFPALFYSPSCISHSNKLKNTLTYLVIASLPTVSSVKKP